MKLAKVLGLSKAPRGLVEGITSQLRKPLYRNGYALVINSIGTSLLGALYWIIAARFYSTEVTGINAAAISTMIFLSTAARFYLDGVLIRFLPRAGKAAAHLIQHAYLIGGLASAVIGAIFLVGLNLWAPTLGFLRETPGLAIMFLAATIASCIFVEQDGALVGLRQAHWVPVENILFASAKIVLLVAFAKPLPQSGIMFSWIIPLMITLVPVNLLIFRKLVPRHIQESSETDAAPAASQIAHYAGGLYAGYIFSAASLRLMPLVVLQVVGSHSAAYFTLPWMIVTSLQMVIPSMMGSLTVEASRDPSKIVKYSRAAFAQTALLMTPMILILFLGGPALLHLFGKSYAAEAGVLLRLLTLATLPQIITALYFGIARVHRTVGGVVKTQASLFVMNLILSILFLAKLGITGVGIAWLISQSVMALVLLITQLRPVLWPKRADTSLS